MPFLNHSEKLAESLQKLAFLAPAGFCLDRSSLHLQRILGIYQSFHKKIHALFAQSDKNDFGFLLKIFQRGDILCFALAVPLTEEQTLDRYYFSKIARGIMGGLEEIPHSGLRWLHPDLPVFFLYTEMQKVRGKPLTPQELRLFKQEFFQAVAMCPLSSSLSFQKHFLPLNEEESYKQIVTLSQEMRKNDLPEVSIHFRQLVNKQLEFLIHLVRPASLFPLSEQATHSLPSSISFLLHFSHIVRKSPPLEGHSFSLFCSIHAADRDALNILHARQRILYHVKKMIGPFRDYNGGLLEQQQNCFEQLSHQLGPKLFSFYPFAEKLFYSIYPLETRVSLTTRIFEDFLSLIYSLMQTADPQATHTVSHLSGCKTPARSDVLPLLAEAKAHPLPYCDLMFNGIYYFCFYTKTAHTISLSSKKRPKWLRLGFQDGAPPSLNPYLIGDARCQILNKLLFDGLVRLDSYGKPQPSSAQRISISTDGRKYTFQLRPSYWSNGTEVTSFDYVYGWTQALQSSSADRLHLLLLIKHPQHCPVSSFEELGFKILNKYTFELNLEIPDPFFLEKLTHPCFSPLKGDIQEPSLFNGPYFLSELHAGGLELEKNPYFWNSSSIFFEKISVKWIHTSEMAHALFQKKEIDWLGDPLVSLPVEALDQATSPPRKSLRPFWIFLNVTHPLLKSSKIRQALNLSLEREVICNSIFTRHIPLYCPIPTTQQPLLLIEENVQKAQALFQQGLQELHLSNASLPPLTFTYNSQPYREELAYYLQARWKAIFGFSLTLKKEPWNSLCHQAEKGAFDLIGYSVTPAYSDALAFLEKVERKTLYNLSQWEDSEYQMLLSQIRLSSGEGRTRLIQEAERLLLREVPYIPICLSPNLRLSQPGLVTPICNCAGFVDFQFAFFEDLK